LRGGLRHACLLGSPQASGTLGVLGAARGTLRLSPRALLPGRIAVHALCARGNGTKQKILARPPRPGVRILA